MSTLYFQVSLGIDIRERSVALTLLGKKFNKIDVVASHIFRIPSQLELGNVQSETIFLEELQRFLAKEDIRPDDVCLSLPRGKYSLETFEIPIPEEKFIDSMLEFELDKHISSDIKNFYFSCHKSPREGKMMRVTSAVLKKESANYYLELIYRLKLVPSILDLSTFANANLVLSGKLDPAKPVAIADLGPNDLEITIIKNREIEFSRQVPLDDPEIAEVYFLPDADGERFDSLMPRLSAKIIDQIQEGLSVCRDIDESESLNRIFLMNGGSFAPFLCRDLEKESGAVTSQFQFPREIAPRIPESHYPSLMSTSLGLGLRALTSNVLETNLLPPSLQPHKRKKKVKMAYVLPATAILLFTALMGIKTMQGKAKLADLEKQLQEVKGQAEILTHVDVESAGIQNRLGSMNRIEREHPARLPVMRELSETLPRDTWLTHIKIRKTKMEIKGFSASASQLVPLLEKSPYFKEAGFVGAVVREKALEKFTIKMKLAQNP